MNILKETTKTIFNIIIFAVLPLVVFTLITSKVSTLFDIRSFVVLTGSMQPLIPTGSVVYSQKQASYNKGDIITFEQNGVTVTHRIADIKRRDGELVYKTFGDANNTLDSEPVLSNNIIGKAQFHFPLVGQLIFFLKTMEGFIALIIVPTVLFILFELYNIKKEIEKEAEKKFLKRMQQYE